MCSLFSDRFELVLSNVFADIICVCAISKQMAGFRLDIDREVRARQESYTCLQPVAVLGPISVVFGPPSLW